MKQVLAYAAKFVTALLTVAGIALSQGLIEGTAAKWAAIAISFAGALGVYAVPNKAPAPPVPTVATVPTALPAES